MQANVVLNSKLKYSNVDIRPEAMEELSHVPFPG